MAHLESRPKLQPSHFPGQPHGQLNSAVPLQPSIPAPSRKPSFLKKMAQGVGLLAVSVASACLGLSGALILPLPPGILPNDKGARSLQELLEYGFQYRVARPVNILIMGIDRVPGAKGGSEALFSGRSDTMLLLRIDPSDDSVSLLSIPRDTQVDIPGVGVTKINDANVQGGPQLAAKTVSSTLNGVPIDRYVRVSTEAFRELVDLLGGVEVYVPQRMTYEDKTQKLKIDLQPGLQNLSGDQAEQFARFRHDGFGDIGRVQRQQALLKALRQRATNPMVIPRIPSLIGEMQKYIDTNLSLEEMLALVGAVRRLSQGDVRMVMLPGRFSQPNEFVASYWIMNPEGRDRVMRQYFKLGAAGDTSNALSSAATSLRIAIQNASSQPDGADQMRQYLVSQGFVNVYVVSDWSDQQSNTQIIVQQGDLDSARSLQKTLGFAKLETDSTGDLDSDLTIRVGNDWLNRSR